MPGDGGTLLRVLVGALVGDAGQARAVVIAGVVGAEAFDEAGAAGVAVTASARRPSAMQALVGVRAAVHRRRWRGRVPRRWRRWGRPSGSGRSRSRSVLLLAGSWPSGFCSAKNVMWLLRATSGRKLAVDERLLRAALHPDAAVDGALDEHGLVDNAALPARCRRERSARSHRPPASVCLPCGIQGRQLEPPAWHGTQRAHPRSASEKTGDRSCAAR